jgi:hypothetical protein
LTKLCDIDQKVIFFEKKIHDDGCKPNYCKGSLGWIAYWEVVIYYHMGPSNTGRLRYSSGSDKQYVRLLNKYDPIDDASLCRNGYHWTCGVHQWLKFGSTTICSMGYKVIVWVSLLPYCLLSISMVIMQWICRYYS